MRKWTLFLLALIALSTFCMRFWVVDPNATDLLKTDLAPSAAHWLGTDDLGRDVFSRWVHGTFTSLSIATIILIIQTVLGTFLGCLSGYSLGATDWLLFKLSELIRCFPFFVLAIVLAMYLGNGPFSIICILGGIGWTNLYVVVRSETLSIQSQEYILAAKLQGVSKWRILTHHIFPNLQRTVLTMLSMNAAYALLSESSLSFLGIGIAPPTATLGSLLSSARNLTVLSRYWWQWLPAVITILVVLLLLNALQRTFGHIED